MTGLDLVIKIKSWDKLAKKYGLNENRDIDLKCTFTKELEEALPKNRTIKVKIDRLGNLLWIKDRSKSLYWVISYKAVQRVYKIQPKKIKKGKKGIKNNE